MPRKTKEQKELENEKKEVKKPTTTKKSTTKATSKKATTTKKTTTKKSTATKKAATKKSTTSKTPAVKKASASRATSKKSTATAKKKTTSTKKSTAEKVATKKPTRKKVEIVEYYDLPYRYNQTIVKVLAQTPTTLFVYWDISDTDRKAFEEKYGENFFETTKPVLIVYNDTKGYSFEVEINDFANSWYLHVSDSKCEYRIELASNVIESPNDRILFDSAQKQVFFRDVKTGFESKKSIYNISLLRNMGKIYNIYDLYKAIYSNENVENIYDLYNPSSSSSSF